MLHAKTPVRVSGIARSRDSLAPGAFLTAGRGAREVPAADTRQKISGRLTSEDATQDRLGIRSYIDTARKHGQDVLHVLHRLMLGDP
jgi:hypothetical protein